LESRSEPEIFFRSLFQQCYGCICFNVRYHSVATDGQLTFILNLRGIIP